MEERSDSKLMELYGHGDGVAFEELFRRYEGRAYGYFLRRTRSPDRARDLYQDLFLRIHRFRDRFDASQRFGPWFFAIASRVFLDDLRRSHGIDANTDEEFTDVAAGGSGVEGDAIARELVAQALGGLSSEQRSVLVAAKLGGFEYAEIADELGKTVQAVKQMASRAMRRLRAAEGRG